MKQKKELIDTNFENAEIIRFEIATDGTDYRGPKGSDGKPRIFRDWIFTLKLQTENHTYEAVLPLVKCDYDGDHDYYERNPASKMTDFVELMESCGVSNIFSLRNHIVRLREISDDEIEIAPVIGGRWFKIRLCRDKS